VLIAELRTTFLCSDVSDGRGVRAQLVGDDALRRAALLLEQAPQPTSRRLGVATRLQNFDENVALLIYRAPEPVRQSADADSDLVEMSNVATAWLLASEAANEILAELPSPTPHGLVRDYDPALRQHFFDEADSRESGNKAKQRRR
jgi:hypothetical protein